MARAEVIEELQASMEQKYSDLLGEIQKITVDREADADISVVLRTHNTALIESVAMLEKRLHGKVKRLSRRKKEIEAVELSLREANAQHQEVENNYMRVSAELKESERVWAQQAEELVKALEEARQKVVDDFKASEEFWMEVIDGSTQSYTMGFNDCRSMVMRLFLELDLSRVAFDAEEEEGRILPEEATASSVRTDEVLPAEDPVPPEPTNKNIDQPSEE